MRRRRADWVGMIALVATLASCGGEDAIVADPALAEFVGDWSATSLVLSSPVAPDVEVDLIEVGSTFSLNVQPSGQYTAVLVFLGQAQTEIGHVSLSGASTVILTREFPTPSTEISTYVFEGPDRLILDGDTEFDFNLDGTPEAALAHFELSRN